MNGLRREYDKYRELRAAKEIEKLKELESKTKQIKKKSHKHKNDGRDE